MHVTLKADVSVKFVSNKFEISVISHRQISLLVFNKLTSMTKVGLQGPQQKLIASI